MSKLDELRQECDQCIHDAKALVAGSKADSRDLNEEEKTKIDAWGDRVDELKGEIVAGEEAQAADVKRLDRLGDHDKWATTPPSQPTKQPQPRIESADIRTDPDPKGFESFGHMLQAVAAVPTQMSRGEQIDPRLGTRQAATGLSEGVASDGGFLVATDFSSDLMVETYNSTVVLEGGPGFSGVTKIPLSTSANGIKINALNETDRAAGSRWGGVQAFWLNEAGTKTASKPTFRQVELSLHKLIGLVYATDELLEDASALEAVVRTSFAEEFSFQIQDALINGNGTGKPLGILASNAKVSVAKESGQDPATVVKENIDKMYTRMKPTSVARAVWYINQNVYPQLFSLTQDVGTGGLPVYLPPGGLSASPFGTLYGRPVVPIEQAASVGTQGDIMFVDMSAYLFIDKGTIKSDSSIHVQFTTDETVFRFVFRCDGQPAMASPLTPFKGTGDTISSFVFLDDRS